MFWQLYQTKQRIKCYEINVEGNSSAGVNTDSRPVEIHRLRCLWMLYSFELTPQMPTGTLAIRRMGSTLRLPKSFEQILLLEDYWKSRADWIIRGRFAVDTCYPSD